MTLRSDGCPAPTLVTALALVLICGAGVVAASERTPAPPSPPSAPAQPANFVGDETCVTCHDSEGKSLKATLHGKAQNVRTPAARSGQACETCHGPGQKHVDSGNKEDIRRFTAMAPREASETCLSCHSRSNHTQFYGGPHDSRNLSCVSCHSVHSPKSAVAQLKTATEIETCASCHKAQAMKVTRTQHMPIVEGKMSCSSCHNPHGSTNVKQLRVGNYVNEACVSCHAEKRGPFLWEHAAGRESCITCHDPHGSSNDRMLVAKPPMLCQRCHIGTRHPSTIYDGKNVQNVATASNRIYGRACVNCHSNIHGSNHPSGNAFLR
jgi:DmsE family decaheme c-type cytochrome